MPGKRRAKDRNAVEEKMKGRRKRERSRRSWGSQSVRRTCLDSCPGPDRSQGRDETVEGATLGRRQAANWKQRRDGRNPGSTGTSTGTCVWTRASTNARRRESRGTRTAKVPWTTANASTRGPREAPLRPLHICRGGGGRRTAALDVDGHQDQGQRYKVRGESCPTSGQDKAWVLSMM